MRLWKCVLSLVTALTITGCGNSNPYKDAGPVAPIEDVTNVPEKIQGTFAVHGETQIKGLEGQGLIQKFEIQNVDNRQGPFRVYLTGAPAGTEIKMISATVFELHFRPGSTFVKGQNQLKLDFYVHVIDPENRIVDLQSTWTIQNAGVGPYLLGPTQISAVGSTNLQFTMLAEDLNGEEFAHFSILSPTGQSGLIGTEVLLETDAKNIFPTTLFNIQWNPIPASMAGQTVTIQVQACTRTYQKCATQDVRVNF